MGIDDSPACPEQSLRICPACLPVCTDAVDRAPWSCPANEPDIVELWFWPGKANPTSPDGPMVTTNPVKWSALGSIPAGVHVVRIVSACELVGVDTPPEDVGNWARPAQALECTGMVSVATPPVTRTAEPEVEHRDSAAVTVTVSGEVPVAVSGGEKTTEPSTCAHRTLPPAAVAVAST